MRPYPQSVFTHTHSHIRQWHRSLPCYQFSMWRLSGIELQVWAFAMPIVHLAFAFKVTWLPTSVTFPCTVVFIGFSAATFLYKKFQCFQNFLRHIWTFHLHMICMRIYLKLSPPQVSGICNSFRKCGFCVRTYLPLYANIIYSADELLALWSFRVFGSTQWINDTSSQFPKQIPAEINWVFASDSSDPPVNLPLVLTTISSLGQSYPSQNRESSAKFLLLVLSVKLYKTAVFF